MKNSDKDFVTKKDIDNLKAEMTSQTNKLVTKRDAKKFATKQDLNKMTNAIAVQIVEINNQTRKDIKNDILTFQDKILHEIVKFREDNEMIIGQRQRIEDHEERIAKLESCQLA